MLVVGLFAIAGVLLGAGSLRPPSPSRFERTAHNPVFEGELPTGSEIGLGVWFPRSEVAE